MSIYEYDQEKHMRMQREADLMEGKKEGRIEGRIEGEIQKLIAQVCKKLQKNCRVPDIADMLEEKEEDIQRICDIAQTYAPDYNIEKILDEILKKR